MSCEYIQSTHRLALLCQNPKSSFRSTRSTRIRSSLQGRTLWVSPSTSATSPTAVFRGIKNLEARWCLKNNVHIVVCAMSATDAASPSVVVSNLFIIPKPGINIGFAIVYQEISIPVFLGLECVESRSAWPGRHRAWYQSLTACRRPLEPEPLSLESHACCTYLFSNSCFSTFLL